MSLGTILRQQREKLGMTLDELARLTDFSKPYLSTVETGKVKNPPSDELLVRLEQHLKFDKGYLLHMAHMERVPADIKHALEHNEAENSRLKGIIKALMDSGSSKPNKKTRDLLNNITSEGTETKQPRNLIPIINKVSAGYPADYSDLDYPPGGADDYVRCPDLNDPNAFAVRVVGDSMEPKFHEGDIIVFSPARQVQSGDDCFVRIADPYEATFKRVYFQDNETIRLQPRNQNYPPIIMPANKISGLWKAVMRYEQL